MDIETRMSVIEADNRAQGERLASLERDNKAMWKRIDEQNKLITEVRELAIAVKMLAEDQRRTNEKLDETRTDVKALKDKPGLHWDRVSSAIITAVVGGLVAYVLFSLGLKP